MIYGERRSMKLLIIEVKFCVGEYSFGCCPRAKGCSVYQILKTG